MDDKEAECIGVGIKLLRDNLSFRQATPIMFKPNLRLPTEQLIIPSSEAALHQKAAGKEVVAVFASPRLAFVGFKSDDGACSFAYGLRQEMLSPSLNERMGEMLKVRAVVEEELEKR